jgi:hypothetical protein
VRFATVAHSERDGVVVGVKAWHTSLLSCSLVGSNAQVLLIEQFHQLPMKGGATVDWGFGLVCYVSVALTFAEAKVVLIGTGVIAFKYAFSVTAHRFRAASQP